MNLSLLLHAFRSKSLIGLEPRMSARFPENAGDEPYLGTGGNAKGCLVPHLTRLGALPCEGARRGRL
jgi:hypothetical protein